MSHKARKRLRGEARDQVRETLGDMMRVLRNDIAAKMRILRRQTPRPDRAALTPCDTCGFRANQDDTDGFEGTVINVIGSLADGHNFYCHHDVPKDAEGRYLPVTEESAAALTPCKAWAMLHVAPAFKLDAHFPMPLILGLAAFSRSIRSGIPVDAEAAIAEVEKAMPAPLAMDDIQSAYDAMKVKARRTGPRSVDA